MKKDITIQEFAALFYMASGAIPLLVLLMTLGSDRSAEALPILGSLAGALLFVAAVVLHLIYCIQNNKWVNTDLFIIVLIVTLIALIQFDLAFLNRVGDLYWRIVGSPIRIIFLIAIPTYVMFRGGLWIYMLWFPEGNTGVLRLARRSATPLITGIFVALLILILKLVPLIRNANYE